MTELHKLGRLVIWLRYIDTAFLYLSMVKKLRDEWPPENLAEQSGAVEAQHRLQEALGTCIANMVLLPISDERAMNPNDVFANFGY